MRALAAVLLLAAATARAAEPVRSPLRACVKWSKDAPDLLSAGEPYFSSVARVEGKGPWKACDAVASTADFGVGWFMRTWMREDVLSACGEKLGSFSFHYKGDEWQPKVFAGLADWLAKNPEAFKSAKPCSFPEPAPAPEAPKP